jgi:hypothetical protein
MLEKYSDQDSLNLYLNEFNPSSNMRDDEFEEAIDTIALALLYDTPWEDSIRNNKRRKIPLLTDLPIICYGDQCTYAKKCSVLKNTKNEDKIKLLGTECRDERIFIIEQFSEWIKNLEIPPEDSSSILNVASLIRILIYKRRTDRHIAILGSMYEKRLVAVDNKGNEHWDHQVSQLHALSEKYNKQILSIQSQLMASRKDRAQFAAQAGKNMEDIKNLLTQRIKKNKERELETIENADYIDLDE